MKMTDFKISIYLVLYHRSNNTILKEYYRIDDSTLSGFFQEEGVADYDNPIWKTLAAQCSTDFNQTIYKDSIWMSSASNKEFYEKYVETACSASGICMDDVVRIKAKLYPWSSACDEAYDFAMPRMDRCNEITPDSIRCSS